MTTTPLRIAFMGTPDFALSALKALNEGPHSVVCAYSQPPRPKGRGHKVQPSPVQAYAEQHDIPAHHPKSLKSPEEQEIFAYYKPDVAIVAAYGLLLPKAILETPKYGCINIHASLLPRWRGASPIQHAIWKGDAETGVTLMQMDEGLDTGPMITKATTPITASTTTPSLHDTLAALGVDMVGEVLDMLSQNQDLNAEPQDNDQSTYAPLLTKENGRIDWAQNANDIDRQIRALNPWPGTYTGEGDARLKVLSAALFKDDGSKNRPVGTLLSTNGDVGCGAYTAIRLISVQPAGKKPMDIQSAINGGYLKPGERLA